MKEIHPNLFIGDQGDYERKVKGRKEWKVEKKILVHCNKGESSLTSIGLLYLGNCK